MVPDHSTKYEENPASHHGGMHKDGLTDGCRDGQMDGRSRLFLYSLIPLLQHREYNILPDSTIVK